MSRDESRKRRDWAVLLALFAIAFALPLVLGPSPASAALAEENPWGGPRCLTGSAAGECEIPRGIAADPDNGHVFVGDQVNRRINEFNALGEFIKSWGWGVDTGTEELQTCTAASGCQAGLNGPGVGQISAPLGLAVDSMGVVYVVDFSNRRVQKFDPEGSFLLMFGGGVNETSGGNVCPRPGFPADVCKAAVAASGGGASGEFGEWAIGDFVTIDNKGTESDTDDEIYVGDQERIQRFDAGGVYQDECAVPGETVQSLDIDATGDLYAIYNNKPDVRKLSFVAGGECDELDRFELPQLGPGPPVPTAVAVDAAGDVYAFGPVNPGAPTDPIFRFDSEGNLKEQFGSGEFSASTGVATNLCPGSEAPGNLYVSNTSQTEAFIRAYGTPPVGCFKARTLPPTPVEETIATLRGTVNPSGLPVTQCFFEYGTTTEYGQIAECEPSAGELGEGTEPVPVSAEVSALAAATVHHVRLIAVVGGETETGADVEFKTKGPPVISEDHVVSVTQTEATLKALVNPEGLPTTYHFQYTTQANFEAQGFTGAQSTAPTPIGEDREFHPAMAVLKGLTPGTSYRWRIVATNTAVLNEGVSEGPTRSLRTYLPAEFDRDCPNQAFRIEASAFLPDCRAYEMVSPVDKNGGDIERGSISPLDPDGYVQAAPDGESITYTALAGFGELESAANFNQYLAARGEGGAGWSNRGIRPPTRGAELGEKTLNGFRQFTLFTPDLCFGWLIDYQTPPLTEEAIDGYWNLYRRENCAPGEGELETLTDVEPPAGTVQEFIDRREAVHGASADGSHALFVAQAKLTPEAPEDGGYKLYDRFGGAIHLVSIAPDGSFGDLTPGDGMGVPTVGRLGTDLGWRSNLAGAVSEDGSRVYWMGSRLYLRLHPEQGLVADECSEASKACTVAVSKIEAIFWGASSDGSKAIYTEGGKLFEFDLTRYEAEPASASRLIAEEAVGVAGAADDLSRVYFVSRAALAGAASAGKPNLYLYEADDESFVFVGALSEKDVGEKEIGICSICDPYHVASRAPIERATRVSADGSAIAFNSRAALSGYDNTHTASGKAAVEVFLFDADSGELRCASCNPSGARPQALAEMNQPYEFSWLHFRQTGVPVAAWLPTWEQSPYASRPLSADGERLFFNSYDALLPRDTNGQMDVYEWEAAGTGGCEAGEADYFPANGGCIYLISTGESPYESEFWEASSDGEDVFFTSEASLVPPDPGSIDLYDARAGGGFSYPEPGTECEGEACQSPPAPPQFTAPSSSTYNGPTNPGAAGNCRAPARRAARLSRLSRRARKAAQSSSEPQRSRQLRRRSAGLAKQAKRASRQAKRCRRAGR